MSHTNLRKAMAAVTPWSQDACTGIVDVSSSAPSGVVVQVGLWLGSICWSIALFRARCRLSLSACQPALSSATPPSASADLAPPWLASADMPGQAGASSTGDPC